MEIDDYDISFSSICDRINSNPQQAKKELLHWCKKTKKAEKKVEELEEKLNEAKRNVRYFKQGIYNTYLYFCHQIYKLPSTVVLRDGKRIYIIKYNGEENIAIDVEKETL